MELHMPWFKDPAKFKQSTSDEFDTLHMPGYHARYSGIYRCTGCGKEISHNADVSLPPQNHHQHGYGQGAILWQMVAAANTDGS
jgi:hypothetical protein